MFSLLDRRFSHDDQNHPHQERGIFLTAIVVDHTMSTNVPPSSSSDPLPVPREALVMKQILESMGVEKYEPRVVSQLMEFAQRYVTSVVEDADDYKAHARKAIIGTYW